MDATSFASFRIRLPTQDRGGTSSRCGRSALLADVRRHRFKCKLEKNQMRKTLMVSVAVAALSAATGLATAQGVSQGGVKGSEPPTAASPKGDTAAPMNEPAAKGAGTATPGASPKDGAPQHAQ